MIRSVFRHLSSILAAVLIAAVAAPTSAEPAGPVVVSEFIYATAPYPQAHASTVVETRTGVIAAAWFGGAYERSPDVEIWFARRGPAGWETPVSVADGVQADGSRLPTWNPVLFQDPEGALHLFYKTGPSPSTWWGMERTSTDDGRHWSPPRRLPDGILGPIKNKPVVLADGSWLSPSSTETPAEEWSIHFERSEDRGQTWTSTPPVASPVGLAAIQPSLLFHPDGRLEAVARTRQGVLSMTWSNDGGRTWSPLAAIDLPNPNAGADAVTLRDGRQLIVYNHSAHLPGDPGHGPRWPLNLALSDDGVTWRKVLTLEDAPLKDGYAYPAIIQTRDGLVHLTYTYNRERIRHVVLDPSKLE
ncbi:MAG: exo-alpha-sialidase [Brevundimonas sp.]